jgi:hypothetical protein
VLLVVEQVLLLMPSLCTPAMLMANLRTSAWKVPDGFGNGKLILRILVVSSIHLANQGIISQGMIICQHRSEWVLQTILADRLSNISHAISIDWTQDAVAAVSAAVPSLKLLLTLLTLLPPDLPCAASSKGSQAGPSSVNITAGSTIWGLTAAHSTWRTEKWNFMKSVVGTASPCTLHSQ